MGAKAVSGYSKEVIIVACDIALVEDGTLNDLGLQASSSIKISLARRDTWRRR